MEGAIERVRPKMMTVVAIMAGLYALVKEWRLRHRPRVEWVLCRFQHLNPS